MQTEAITALADMRCSRCGRKLAEARGINEYVEIVCPRCRSKNEFVTGSSGDSTTWRGNVAS